MYTNRIASIVSGSFGMVHNQKCCLCYGFLTWVKPTTYRILFFFRHTFINTITRILPMKNQAILEKIQHQQNMIKSFMIFYITYQILWKYKKGKRHRHYPIHFYFNQKTLIYQLNQTVLTFSNFRWFRCGSRIGAPSGGKKSTPKKGRADRRTTPTRSPARANRYRSMNCAPKRSTYWRRSVFVVIVRCLTPSCGVHHTNSTQGPPSQEAGQGAGTAGAQTARQGHRGGRGVAARRLSDAASRRVRVRSGRGRHPDRCGGRGQRRRAGGLLTAAVRRRNCGRRG